MRLFSALSTLLLAATAFAQIEATITNANQLIGAEKARRVGEYLLVESADQLKTRPVILVEIDTEAANVIAECTNEQRLPVEFVTIDRTTYLMTTPGKQWLELLVVDFEKNIFAKRDLVLEVGSGPTPPPGPDPPPDPDPPDPNPDIDNEYGLGQIAYDNAPSAGTAAVADLYKRAAEMLYGRPRGMTVEAALNWLDQGTAKVALQGDPEGWEKWAKAVVDNALVASQRARPEGYTRADWYAAFNEIAKALGAVK